MSHTALMSSTDDGAVGSGSSESTAIPAQGHDDTSEIHVDIVHKTEPAVHIQHISRRRNDTDSSHSSCPRSSHWVLGGAAIYTALALFSWITQCQLNYNGGGKGPRHDTFVISPGERVYSARAAKLYRAADVIAAIVAVTTIPLTSAICSAAAVAYTQRNRKLTLRQTMTLADKRWVDPGLLYDVMIGHGRQTFSLFLVAALVLIVTGAVVAPLQSLFRTTVTARIPNRLPTTFGNLRQVRDLFQYAQEPHSDQALSVLRTRLAITSTFSGNPQSRLWTQGITNCTIIPNAKDLYPPVPGDTSCSALGNTLWNITSLPDPFLAQVPQGFTTGLIPQYLPRMNSSSHVQSIDEESFPKDCDTLPGALYAAYGGSSKDYPLGSGDWSIVACMPANQKSSPWMDTRNRQDISEVLYLNVSTKGVVQVDRTPYVSAQTSLLKVTLNTTLGYFELPNYANGGQPGPLLEHPPSELAELRRRGIIQSRSTEEPSSPVPPLHRRAFANDTVSSQLLTNNTIGLSNSTLLLQTVANKGPLLNIAMALFGQGSFISMRTQYPNAYLTNVWNTAADESKNEFVYAPICVDQAPLIGLLTGSPSYAYTSNTEFSSGGCVQSDLTNLDELATVIEDWIAIFSTYAFPGGSVMPHLSNAFTAAAFLANEAWLFGGSESSFGFIDVDLGTPVQMPSFSQTGVCLVSALLGIFLIGLWAMALYSIWTPSWTSNLNSFAMLRIGASLADRIALVYTDDARNIRALDELPGWIGDATEGAGNVGELGLGATKQLSRARRLRCWTEERAKGSDAES